MQIRAANSAVRDLDVDIGLFERFGFIGLPLHVPLVGILVEAKPSLELVVCGHGRG
jgi:hypothetical protein